MTPPRKRTTKKRPAGKRSTAGATVRDLGKDRVHLVTGYPGFIGKRLVEALALHHPESRVIVLAQEKFEKDAKAFSRSIRGAGKKAEIEVLAGDVVNMDLGLAGAEYAALIDEVTDIFHLAAIYYLGVEKRKAHAVNVEGTRRMLETAGEARRLRRFNHMSTVYVCGDRAGVIAEDELEMGQRFRNFYEETKYEAETEVRDAMAELPISVYRPSIVIGDSRTGEIDRFNGPYYFGILLVTSPLSVPLPLPGDGVAPLNVVPVDFVVEAMITLNEDPEAEGRTFHLVDPNPMSSRRVYEMIAERAGKKLPRVTLSHRMTEKVLRLPGLERLTRQQRQAVEYVNHLAIFNCHNTLELLDGTGVRCPPLNSYMTRLMAYVRSEYRRRQDAGVVAEDALDD